MCFCSLSRGVSRWGLWESGRGFCRLDSGLTALFHGLFLYLLWVQGKTCLQMREKNFFAVLCERERQLEGALDERTIRASLN